MSKKRRALVVLIGLLLAALALNGCQNHSVQIVAPEKEPVSLRFVGYKVGATKVEEIEVILEQYMESHDDVVIVYEGVGDDYVNVLTNRLKSGRADDLFMLSDQSLTTYVHNGWCGSKIVNLSEHEIMQRYSPLIQKLITVDGQVPAVPMCLSVVGMMGNMDILRECGIQEMPRTFDQWVEDMEIVQAHGYTPMVNYLGNAASLHFLMAARATAPYIEGTQTLTEASTAESVYAQGIKDIYELVERGLIDRQQMAAANEPRAYQKVLGEQFAAGGAAFAVVPSWGLTAFMSGEPAFEYVYGGLPMGDEGPLINVRASVMVALNNEGEHKEEAAAFLDYLMQPEHIERYAAEQTSLSPLAGAKSADPLFAETVAQIAEGRMFSDTDPSIPFNLLKVLNQAAAGMAQGEELEQILNQFSQAVAAETGAF